MSNLPEGNTVLRKQASLTGAVFNIATSIIGAGIMSIPATLKVLGIFPAFILMVGIAWLTQVSVEFLSRYTNAGASTTYAGVMKEYFGRVGSAVLQITILVINFGILVVFLIIIGDVLSGSNSKGSSEHLGILEQWFGGHWWEARAYTLLFVVVVLLLPFALVRRVEMLKYSSAISVFLAVLFVAICTCKAINEIVKGNIQRPNLVPRMGDSASYFKLFTAVPVIATAFTYHFNVHPISNEINNPPKFLKAARLAIILCAVIYFSIGLFGYLLFGDSIMSDLLVNFDRSLGSTNGSVVNDVLRLSYTLHLVTVYPVLNYPLRANVDELLFANRKPLDKATTRFVCLTVVLLGFAYLAAIAIPDIWFFFQFVGSTCAVSIAYIFPSAIVLRDVHGISTTRDRIIALVLIVLAVGTSGIAITSNVIDLTKKKA